MRRGKCIRYFVSEEAQVAFMRRIMSSVVPVSRGQGILHGRGIRVRGFVTAFTDLGCKLCSHAVTSTNWIDASVAVGAESYYRVNANLLQAMFTFIGLKNNYR